VGKSSLVNALAGKEIMAVGEIREEDSRGRHTTTHRQLLLLSSGAMVIDTPGMRELAMWDVSEGLVDAFADVEKYIGRCRFSDCSHAREPGCAIRAAIRAGELDIARWESYRKLKEEAVDKEELLRRKHEWSKGVAKFTRQRNKEIW
jgi:ribosome biogenesis GTPase